VLTHGMIDDITTETSPTKSNKRLLRIMMRRSVAHARTFIQCLLKTRQKNMADKLNESCVFVCVHSTMNTATMTNEQKQQRESWFVKIFRLFIYWRQESGQHLRMYEACTYLENNGCTFVDVEERESIAWHIKCQTLESLERLRAMYNSNELAYVLHDIFNDPRCGGEVVPLYVVWSSENYEICKKVMRETSCRPFGRFDDENDDEDDENNTTGDAMVSKYYRIS